MTLPITLSHVQVSSSDYMQRVGSLFVADNWLWMVLPVAVCGVLGAWMDVRFWIVALMVLLVVLPMVLALLYFYYGLSPEARWSLMEKEVTIDASGLTLTFAHPQMQPHTVAWNDVRAVLIKKDCLLLMSPTRRYACLMLPASVAIDPDIAQVLRQLVAQAHERAITVTARDIHTR